MTGDPITRLAEFAFQAFPTNAVMETIVGVSRFDRFQASRGIESSADYVAEGAQAAGLIDVEIVSYPADGERRWWSFRAPVSWSPVAAWIRPGDGDVPIAEYPKQPFSLATYSAPTPGGERGARLLERDAGDAGPGDALMLIEGGRQGLRAGIDRARRAGALGVVVSCGPDAAAGAIGRVELPHASGLVGFSVDPPSYERLRAMAAAGSSVRVAVELESAEFSMPVVTGRIPGEEPTSEALVVSHLCHPGPGANDNASGVACATGVAHVLAGLARDNGGWPSSIRFVWAPEFVGLAAFAHERREVDGHAVHLVGGINLDMVGEDQRQCGGAMVIERPAERLMSHLDVVAENAAYALPAIARSYSSAVDTSPWAWRIAPHVGASDHGLLCQPPLAVPTVLLTHWPDRFNHSSLDTIDRVDALEVRRAGAIASCVAAVAAGERLSPAQLRRAILASYFERLNALAREGRRHRPPVDGWDPFAPEHLPLTLREKADGGGTLLARLGFPADVVSLRHHAAALAGAPPVSSDPPRTGRCRRARKRWDGPFNLFGVLDDASPASRAWLLAELDADKGRYGMITAMMDVLDSPGGDALGAATARRAEVAVEERFVDGVLDVLEDAGWIERSG